MTSSSLWSWVTGGVRTRGAPTGGESSQGVIPALRDSGLQCGSWDAPQASGRRLAHYERCDRGRRLAGERGRTACALQGGAQRGGAQADPRLVVGEARAERGRRREDRRGGKAHAHPLVLLVQGGRPRGGAL